MIVSLISSDDEIFNIVSVTRSIIDFFWAVVDKFLVTSA